MTEIAHSKLYRRLSRMRWQVPVVAVLLVLVHQVLEHTWLMHLPPSQHFLTQLLFYGALGPLLAWWALTSLRHSVAETAAAEHALQQAHVALGESNQRLEFLMRVNRRLAGAEDEESLIDVMLELPLEVVPAVGCSLIRFDERGQPKSAVHRGTLDPLAFEAWTAHLSATETRQPCLHCSARRATDTTACPLLAATPSALSVKKVVCLALTRSGREYGVLNIYLNDTDQPDARVQTLLEAMAQEMSLALETQRLRSRELATLYRLQQARNLSNLHDDLVEALVHTVEALDVDGGVLFLTNMESGELQVSAETGRPLGDALKLVQGLAGGAHQAEAPLVIGDVESVGPESASGPRSLLIVPMHSEGHVLGDFALWASRVNAFARWHVRLAATVAGQAALLVENHRLYLQVEHQAALAERARLAREIHDGLAQTLGYLKLRTAQIANWLETGQHDRIAAGLQEARDLLSGAYVDAREAIDGLRLKTESEYLDKWLTQVLSEFSDLSGITVEKTALPRLVLPPEIQVQLQRIVQEALSNIRKHSGARCARLECQIDAGGVALRIADDGRGFDPDDVPPMARHGLRIMRERAELLDADFQIVSHPGAGSQVVIRLPANDALREIQHD